MSKTNPTHPTPSSKYKGKRKGFLHRLFSNLGREKQSGTWGVLCAPTEPRGPHAAGLSLPGKSRTGKAWWVEQLGAQIGAEATTSHGRHSCLALAQRLAMGRNQAGSTLQSQALLGCVGGVHSSVPACYQDGAVTHCILWRSPVIW